MRPAPFWSGPINESRFAALVLDEGAGGAESLVLTSWDREAGGKAGRKTVLARGKSIAPVVTRDGLHVLVQVDPPSDATAGPKAPWKVISLATAKTLNEVALLDPDDETPTIRGDLLFTIAATPGTARERPFGL